MYVNNNASSMLQSMIAAQNSTTTPVTNTIQPDTTLSNPIQTAPKKISAKKLATGAAAAAGIAALVLGGIFLYKTSAKNVQKAGEALLGKADDAFNWAKKELDDVLDIFNKDKDKLTDGLGDITDDAGKLIRKYKMDDCLDNRRILEEFADDGTTVLRRSYLDLDYDGNTNAIRKIRKFINSPSKYDEVINSEVLEVHKGCKDTQFKTAVKEAFTFNEKGEKEIYQNVRQYNNGNSKCESCFIYENDKLVGATKFFKENGNGSRLISYQINDENKLVKQGWQHFDQCVDDFDDLDDLDDLDDFDDFDDDIEDAFFDNDDLGDLKDGLGDAISSNLGKNSGTPVYDLDDFTD